MINDIYNKEMHSALNKAYCITSAPDLSPIYFGVDEHSIIIRQDDDLIAINFEEARDLVELISKNIPL